MLPYIIIETCLALNPKAVTNRPRAKIKLRRFVYYPIDLSNMGPQIDSAAKCIENC